MELHADLSQRVVIDSGSIAWMPSPIPGVERRMLDPQAEEVARATSLERDAPLSRSDRHRHGGGEEIMVLAGVFQDDQGTYPAGRWLRNPPGSVHRPCSEPGCTIWVKTGHLPTTQGTDGSGA